MTNQNYAALGSNLILLCLPILPFVMHARGAFVESTTRDSLFLPLKGARMKWRKPQAETPIKRKPQTATTILRGAS